MSPPLQSPAVGVPYAMMPGAPPVNVVSLAVMQATPFSEKVRSEPVTESCSCVPAARAPGMYVEPGWGRFTVDPFEQHQHRAGVIPPVEADVGALPTVLNTNRRADPLTAAELSRSGVDRGILVTGVGLRGADVPERPLLVPTTCWSTIARPTSLMSVQSGPRGLSADVEVVRGRCREGGLRHHGERHATRATKRRSFRATEPLVLTLWAMTALIASFPRRPGRTGQQLLCGRYLWIVGPCRDSRDPGDSTLYASVALRSRRRHSNDVIPGRTTVTDHSCAPLSRRVGGTLRADEIRDPTFLPGVIEVLSVLSEWPGSTDDRIHCWVVAAEPTTRDTSDAASLGFAWVVTRSQACAVQSNRSAGGSNGPPRMVFSEPLRRQLGFEEHPDPNWQLAPESVTPTLGAIDHPSPFHRLDDGVVRSTHIVRPPMRPL